LFGIHHKKTFHSVRTPRVNYQVLSMAEKSSAMQPSRMLLKPRRITKQIIEIYFLISTNLLH